jgi:hypothetical protein
MVARTHSRAAVPGLALCALATSSLLALAQEPGKSTHPEDQPAPPGQTSTNSPPAVSRYGRFLVGDAAPDVILHDQVNVIGVVAIAPFRRDRVAAGNAPMKVRLLTDGASITARNYGVWDAVTSNPRPAVFLVDRAGKILMMMAGGFPSDGELVRLTRESLERSGELVAQPPPVLD